LSRYVDDTQREEEKGLVEKKPGYTPSLIQRGLEQLGNVQRTARTPDPSTTGYTAHGDTTRPEEVTAEPRTSIFYPTITQDPQYTRPTERVKDTERPEETPHPQEEVPTPKITLPKPVKRPVKTVTSTTGRGDTERPEEAVKTEKRPSPPKSLADRAVTKIIGKVSPRKVEAIGKERYSHQTRDTTRLSELPPVEKRPHIDRSAEVWEAAEAPFVAVSTGLRSAGKGFRTQAALKSDLYSKTVYSGVGLGLRAGASAFEAFTMPVRPILVSQTLENTAKIVTSAKYRGAAISQITKDPLGAGADIIGGFVGGYALGKVISGVGTKIKTRSMKEILDIPDEEFYVKEEWGMRYPETEIVHEKSFVGFMTPEKTKIVDTTSNAKFGTIADDLISEKGWRPTQVGAASDEAISQAKISKSILDKARADRIALMNKGDALVPALIPEDGGIVSTVYHPTFRFNTREIHIPGTRINLPKINPSFIDASKLMGIVGAGSSLRKDTKGGSSRSLLDEISRTIHMAGPSTRPTPKPTPPSVIKGPIIIHWSHRGVIQRKRYDPRYMPPYMPPITIQTPKPKGKTTQIQEQTQIISPRMVPLSTPKLKPPELTHRKTLYIDEPRKKTRKKGRKRKTRGEVRLRPVKLPKGWKF